MPWAAKYTVKHATLLRDVRPFSQRVADDFSDIFVSTFVFAFCGILLILVPVIANGADFMLLFGLLYLRWLRKRKFELPLKMPMNAGRLDPHNPPVGKATGSGKPEGILFIGNERTNGEECWLSDSDARTHVLFLGTTGSGKTEGLKALVANSLCWGSGFVYVDGKADTDLWANLFSLSRRFGRDDDLLVLNYMTGNTDRAAPSNSMNPFSSGSASYLVQMLVELMPEAGGDNAMWKERAVALISALMPALTFKRDRQGMLLDIGTVRDNIELPAIIRLSRDPNLPERVIRGMQSYLATLPGYVDAAFDDDGNERPPSPDSPVYDLSVARQQHGYLSMQFTRSLQSLADDYGYIFKAQLADIDIIDVVLNRRILAVLIPALEKSGDEAANLGKIVAACLKGMMGSTLGANVEGSWEKTVENKISRASSPYITVFDEVGYYTAKGMAVMAAQARSLGFSLVFAAQDLPAMEKRVREEARSIAGNCNLKVFGKLEDPTGTKEFFEKTIGGDMVIESSSYQMKPDSVTGSFLNQPNAGLQTRNRSSYDALKSQRAGQVHFLFAQYLVVAQMPYIEPSRVRALRVQKMLPVPPWTPSTQAREKTINELATRLKDPAWSALAASANPAAGGDEIAAASAVFARGIAAKKDPVFAGLLAVGAMAMTLAGEEIQALPAAADSSAKVKTTAKAAMQTQPDRAQKPSATTSAGKKPPVAQTDKEAPGKINGEDWGGNDWQPEPLAAMGTALVTRQQQPADTQGKNGVQQQIRQAPPEHADDFIDGLSSFGAAGQTSQRAAQAGTIGAGTADSDPRLLGSLVRDHQDLAAPRAHETQAANDGNALLQLSPEIAAILNKAAQRLSEGLFSGKE